MFQQAPICSRLTDWRSGRWPALLGRAPAAALLLAASAAPAQAVSDRQTGAIGFSTQRASAPTSLSETASYRNPTDPGGKPPAVRRIVVHYPAGFRIDTSVPPQCHASDQELQLRGDAACPAGSKVGTGSAEFATGLPGSAATFDVDLEVLNNRDQLIFLTKPHGSNVILSVGRSPAVDGTVTTDIPATPGGPPDGQSSVRRIQFDLQTVTGSGGASYLTTPPTCPASAAWTSVATFTYSDGVSQSIQVATPCTPTSTSGIGHGRRHQRRRIGHKHRRGRSHADLRDRMANGLWWTR